MKPTKSYNIDVNFYYARDNLKENQNVDISTLSLKDILGIVLIFDIAPIIWKENLVVADNNDKITSYHYMFIDLVGGVSFKGKETFYETYFLIGVDSLLDNWGWGVRPGAGLGYNVLYEKEGAPYRLYIKTTLYFRSTIDGTREGKVIKNDLGVTYISLILDSPIDKKFKDTARLYISLSQQINLSY